MGRGVHVSYDYGRFLHYNIFIQIGDCPAQKGDFFMVLDDVYAHLRAHEEEDLELLKKFVAQPSVSARNMGVDDCAEMLRSLLTDLGCEGVQIFPTLTKPMVFGEVKSKRPGAKTILFYGHYDTQPPDPEDEWLTPPFEPTVKNGRLYGLGTADNKGQFLAHILAVRSWLAVTGDVPVGVKFILDGEEESGSPSMPEFVRGHKELLAADFVFNSDGPMNAGDFPEIKLGSRGDLSFTIELTTATHQNHSKTGQLIPNPAIELCRLVASMIDENGRVLIPHFYDDVVPPTEYESRIIDELEFDPAALCRIYGTKRLEKNDKQSYYRQMMFSPTLTINGMGGGYTGPGHKTCVPRSAFVRFDVRLVLHMDAEKVAAQIEEFVHTFNPEIVVKFESNPMLPARTSAELPVCQAVIGAVKSVYPKAVIHACSGGSTPAYVWTDIMKMPCLLVPYGNADQTNHSPNENLRLDCYFNGRKVSAAVIDAVGQMRE